MTVTSSYSIETLKQPSPIYSYGEQSTYSTIAALANGGYAALAVDADGYDDLTIYLPNGNTTGSNFETKFTNAKLTALANGNVMMVGTVASGGLEYRIFDASGNGVGFGALARDITADQVSVVATADGGFTVAERSGTATTGIGVIHYNAAGVAQSSHFELSSSDVWQNPSITRLVNGGYAIAWDNTNGGNTRIYYEVLNDDLSVRLGPTLLDNTGTVNRMPSVTALLNGYFSISYEDNVYSGNGQSDITQYILNANGTSYATFQLESMSGTDSHASTATLTNGMIVTTYTDAFNSSDNDIAAAVYNPTNLTTVVPGQDLLYLSSGNGESNSTVVALADSQFAVSDTFVSNGFSISEVTTYGLVRNTAGDASNNVIVGDSGKDIIHGQGGDDTITPGDGANNTVFGDTGYDTVILSGALNAYTVTRKGLVTTIVRSDGGTDTLTQVEKLQFTDSNVFTPEAVRDLNGDGYSDMLLQNSTSGAIRVWTMNSDGTRNAAADTSKAGILANRVVGTGQFTAATDSNADILLQNTNGTMLIWEMDGATVNTQVNLGALNSAWKAVTTGDFNADGNADILLQNSTSGQIQMWLMNGTTVASKTNIGGASGTAWHVIATADFNGDGKSDILMQNDNGQVLVKLMNGAVTLSTANVGANPGGALKAIAAADFTGDGKADIVLQNSSTNSVVIWTMSGTTFGSSITVGTAPAGQTLTGVGDYNGDGKADLAFQAGTGGIAEWLMNGTTLMTKQGIGSNPGAAWHLVAGTGG